MYWVFLVRHIPQFYKSCNNLCALQQVFLNTWLACLWMRPNRTGMCQEYQSWVGTEPRFATVDWQNHTLFNHIIVLRQHFGEFIFTDQSSGPCNDDQLCANTRYVTNVLLRIQLSLISGPLGCEHIGFIDTNRVSVKSWKAGWAGIVITAL